MDPTAVQDSIDYQKAHLYQSHVPNIIIGFTIGLALAYIGVAARLFSRYLIGIRLKADDYLAILSLVFTNVYCILNLVNAGLYGFGKHQVAIDNPIALTKLITAAEVVYSLPIFCFKASICTLLMRLFPVRWFRWSQMAIIVFVGAYSVTTIVLILTECVPIDAIWNQNVHGHCIDVVTALLILSACNIFTDFIIIVLPMPLLWKLNMSITRKCQLSMMIGLGSLVFIASIVRIVTIKQVSLLDPSYSDAIPAIWSGIEMGLGTLGVCMPTYGPLIVYCRSGRAGLENRRTPLAHGIEQSTEKQSQNSRRTLIHRSEDNDEYHSTLNEGSERKFLQPRGGSFSISSISHGSSI